MTEFIIILFGIIFTFGGIMVLKKNRHLQKVGIKTIGTVLSNRPERRANTRDDDVRDRIVYYSTVKFITEDKRALEVELGDTNPSERSIGTELQLIYDPQFPQEIRLNKYFNIVIGPWIFLGCGAFLFLWGILELAGITNVVQ